MSLAKVKPWNCRGYTASMGWFPAKGVALKRWTLIWRVYRAAMAWHKWEDDGSIAALNKGTKVNDALCAACEAARKAGVK